MKDGSAASGSAAGGSAAGGARGWTVAAIAAGALLAAWPQTLGPASWGLGLPGLEATDHLWALWAALRDGPIAIDTQLINYPAGYHWVLADPLDLLWFAPGYLLGGAGLGWNLVQVGNLALAGLAAAVWCRLLAPQATAAPPIAALAAATAAPLSSSLLTGMSEAGTMGWLALALAALHRLGRTGRGAVLAGILLGLTAWAGPYTALYTALAAPPILLAAAARQRGALLRPLLLAGGIAAAIAAPVAWALGHRPLGLPGSNSGLPEVLADPGAAKNLMLGADPLGLIWPVPGVEPLHAVFLGTTLALLALVGARRHRAVMGAAVILLVLGLGFHLQRDGLVTCSGAPLSLPAAWLSAAIPPVGRAIRWHRAVAPAAILLAALAALGAVSLTHRLRWRRWARAGLTGLMCAEGILRAPLPWPRPVFPIAPPAGYAALSPGPILPLPLTRFRAADPTALRSASLLWQTQHGHPLGGNPHQPGPQWRDPAVSQAAESLLRGDRAALSALSALGFAWVLVQHAHDAERLTDVLGEPAVVAEGVWAWPVP